MCSVSSNWCLFSSKKTKNSRLHCLPKNTSPSGNICLLFKAPKGEWESIWNRLPGLEHQREEDKLGMKVVSVLWHALSPAFLCWAGKVASWVGQFCFSWIFLFILVCTLTGADICVLVPSLLLSQARQDALSELGSAFQNFVGEFCGMLWFCPWRCRGVFRLPEVIVTIVFYVDDTIHSQPCWKIMWEYT